jgi:uncharacterized protein YdcH (DUF465 family)
MHACVSCSSRAVDCHVDYSVSEKCSECVRLSRPCSLTVSDAEWAKLHADLAEVDREIARAREAKHEARARLLRLKRKKQTLQDKRKETFDRESRNVEALEVDEQLAALGPLPSSPGGLSQVSFGFLDRTSPVPAGSS